MICHCHGGPNCCLYRSGNTARLESVWLREPGDVVVSLSYLDELRDELREARATESLVVSEFNDLRDATRRLLHVVDEWEQPHDKIGAIALARALTAEKE